MPPFDFSQNHHLELPDDVFRLLRDAIYRRTGIWFTDSSRYLLQKRLSPRARGLNFDSFQKYFYFLQYDPRADAEFDQIYDLVTTNETYFFREPAQLAAFTEEIVPDLLERKRMTKIRIWSAGCSSGEEPYSIAMLLQEGGGVVETPEGKPLCAPLDTTSPVAWMGYANPVLAKQVRPLLMRLMKEHF